MQALSQREEIGVARLVGATESFVRRPFLPVIRGKTPKSPVYDDCLPSVRGVLRAGDRYEFQ